MQFSAEAISFIDHNLHPDLNSMVPLVSINCRNFVVAQCDVSNDLLLVSEEVSWRTDQSAVHGKKYLLLVHVLYSLDSRAAMIYRMSLCHDIK